jgi:hypothetical protein
MLPAPSNTSDRALVILSHLSALIGVGFVLPFIVWLVKRHDADTVAAHAAEALNFHLSFLFYAICLIPLCFVVIGVPLLIIMAIASVILAIIAAVKASNGEFYRYPLTIRLVR